MSEDVACSCCGKVGPASPPYRYDGLWWCSPACALDECGHATGANATGVDTLTAMPSTPHRWAVTRIWFVDAATYREALDQATDINTADQLDAHTIRPPMRATPDLYAWVGEDELGSGQVGLKQAIVPAGMIPLVSTSFSKASSPDIAEQMQAQADSYGKTIRLVRYVPVETVITQEPKPTANG